MILENEIESRIHLQRILGKFETNENEATVIVISGIHGNEFAGVEASKNVIDTIHKNNVHLLGNIYFIVGNINALGNNLRFDKVDLNRIWKDKNIEKLNSNNLNNDELEQKDIYKTIKNIVNKNKGPFYFIDLHTTSANTTPFITISDSLNNRKFCANFNVPIILGIEEYIDGPLLTYINEYGHISLGFEGGQHFDKKSITNCETFIWEVLLLSKNLKKTDFNLYGNDKALMSNFSKKHKFYEVNYRYLINKNDVFKMKKGFNNFDKIKKKQLLATNSNKKVLSPFNGYIFMPLYQSQGEDGFFIINSLSRYWLYLSSVFRKLKFDKLFLILPGISKSKINDYTLEVNTKTARFLATEIFHLFGYRKKIIKKDKILFIKRDRKIKTLI